MGGLFRGGGKKAPPPEVVKEVVEPKKPDRRAEEQAAALRARSRTGSQRSLLSPQREGAQAGLATKLGGTE